MLWTDARFLGFLPSVVAAAIMLHVIKEIELVNPYQYENRLFSAMKVNKVINIILSICKHSGFDPAEHDWRGGR